MSSDVLAKAWSFAFAVLTLAGCMSGGAGKGADTPPEWFKERRAELRRQGFPELGEVRSQIDPARNRAALATTAKQNVGLKKALLNDPRAEPTYLTPQEIAAWGEKMRAGIEARNVEADFLTDQEVASLRARFDRPRARR